MRRAVGYWGTNHRLRRVVADMLRGRPAHFTAVGGSITWGDGVNVVKGRNDWLSLLEAYLLRVFPESNITVTNAAMPGTGRHTLAYFEV